MYNLQKLTLSLVLLMGTYLGTSQIVVDSSPTPEDIVNLLVGDGVSVSNITFEGDMNQFGSFTNPGDELSMPSGVILATGDCALAVGPNNAGASTLGGGNGSIDPNTPGDPGDPDLNLIAGVNTNDNAVLEFDFVPAGDSLKFFYIFGSEEYDDFECCTVNDAFGFFISGPGLTGPYSSPTEFPDGSVNIALIPETNIGVSINTVNSGNANCGAENCSNLDPNWQDNTIYYVQNGGGSDVQYDGFTVALEAVLEVQCGETYHIKLAIADGGDTAWDSGVFLEEGSFSSNAVNIESGVDNPPPFLSDQEVLEGCVNGFFTIYRPNIFEQDTIGLIVSGTAENGIDYELIPDEVIINPDDGSVQIPLIPFYDGITEGNETVTVQYTYLNSCGEQDTASATMTIVDYVDMVLDIEDPFICPGSNVVLNATPQFGQGPFDYLWSTSSESNTETFDAGDEGVYTVSITDFCDRSLEEEFTVIEPDPINFFEVDDFYCMAQFTGDLVSGGAEPYTYIYNQDSLSTMNNPVNWTALYPGVYDVVIIDQCDQSQTFELVFQVCDTHIPNVFSPGVSPGSNDFFTIEGIAGFPNSRLEMYNRWGLLIFESDNYQNRWDGEGASEGTYYYIFKRSDGKDYSGHLTLIRGE